MSAVKHTPGPWTVADQNPYGILDRSIMASGFCVATVHDTAHHEGCWDADARLIAAAPDMHAALIAAKQEMWLIARHQWTMADFKNWAVIQQIDAALEKADGKPRTAPNPDQARKAAKSKHDAPISKVKRVKEDA